MTPLQALRPDLTVAAIVEAIPATQPVFSRHGIDLCCGGPRSLEFVALAHRIPLADLLVELEAARSHSLP